VWNVGWPQNPEKGWWTVILFKQWSYLILFTPSSDWQNIFFCLVLGSCDPCVSLGDVIHGKLSRILWAASLRHATLRMWTVPCVLESMFWTCCVLPSFCYISLSIECGYHSLTFLSRKWSIPRKATNITNWNHLIKLSLIGILYDSFILHKRRPYFPWPFEPKVGWDFTEASMPTAPRGNRGRWSFHNNFPSNVAESGVRTHTTIDAPKDVDSKIVLSKMRLAIGWKQETKRAGECVDFLHSWCCKVLRYRFMGLYGQL